MGRHLLKNRIIPVQLLLGSRLVKTVGFGDYRDVGNPVSSSRVYSDQDADELVFLNINREERDCSELVRLIQKVSEVCFMPLAVGGGIVSFESAQDLIRQGADKVVINSAAYSDLGLLKEVSDRFGCQAVMISVDARWDSDRGDYVLFSECGRQAQEIRLEEHIARVVEAGAGEILITSIDREGSMEGFDVELIRRAVECTNVPVIAHGGAGNFEHMKSAFVDTGANAVACASLFNFGDNNPIRAKAFLTNYGLDFKIS